MDSWSFLHIPPWVFVAGGIAFGLYEYFTWHFGVFKKLGINGPKPLPLVGTMLPIVKEGIMKHDMDLKSKYGSVVGTFQGRLPVMLVYDTDIIKQVLMKEFSNFTNRLDVGVLVNPLNKMLTVLKDEHWKHVRNHLTPTFSGGKLRKMNSKMIECVETLLKNLESKAESKEIFDIKDLAGAFTMDAIATTAFGLQIDSHNDPNNQFVRMGKKAFDFSFVNPRTLLFFFFPFLLKPLSKFGISLFPKDIVEFFTSAVDRALSTRQSIENTDNMDFIQLMINAEVIEEGNDKKGNGVTKSSTEETWNKARGLSHDEILAQGILFFLAGYETTANTLALFAYSLAVNPEVQEKLIKEIDEVMKDQKHATYDLVQQMPYLDMCLSEVLRLYPAAQRTDRVTKNDISINGLFIPKGMIVGIPIYVLQNDPDVWPNPEKYDPERFSSEAKDSRDPLYYLPFGVGPRSCVGMRLALMELKMSMVHILQKMKFVVCEKTQIPLKLDKLKMVGVDGIKLRVERR